MPLRRDGQDFYLVEQRTGKTTISSPASNVETQVHLRTCWLWEDLGHTGNDGKALQEGGTRPEQSGIM